MSTMIVRTLPKFSPTTRSLTAGERDFGRLRFNSCKTKSQIPSLSLGNRPCLTHNDRFYNAIQYTQNRSFFLGRDDDDDDKKGKKGEKDAKEDDKKDHDDKEADDEPTEPSPTLNNSSKYRRSTRTPAPAASTVPSNVLVPAARLGFGDQAPRYPHLLALPVIRGPVFPGVLTPIRITDNKTISAVEKIMARGSGGYLGVFLRKDIPDFSKGLDKPEIITGLIPIIKS